jgi:hypothetical protein
MYETNSGQWEALINLLKGFWHKNSRGLNCERKPSGRLLPRGESKEERPPWPDHGVVRNVVVANDLLLQ